MLLCSAVQYCAVLCSAVQCSLMQISAGQRGAVQSVVQCSVLQFNAVQGGALKFSFTAAKLSALQCIYVQCSVFVCLDGNTVAPNTVGSMRR